MIDETYMKKENRDKRYKELKERGYDVKRYSIRGQYLHPMYVKDYPHKLTKEDKGFGNTLYQTYFPVLYGVREKYPWEK